MSGALPSWARKGVRVVYTGIVNPDDWSPSDLDADIPDAGGTYTIEYVVTDDPEGVYVGLVEIPNGETHIALLRPLVTTKTEAEDVAMFRDLIRHPEAA